jgi:excisionase family DNA binding protein
MPKTDLGRRFVADYLKIPEIARRLDISEKTARRYIKAGALPSTFIGGAYRVTEEDLEQFFHRAEVRPEIPKVTAPPSPEQPPLNGLEDERRTSILADAVIAAADTWLAAVSNPDINIHKRFGLRDAAIELFDRINERIIRGKLKTLDPEERNEIVRALGKLNEIPEAAYQAMPDETLKEANEERRKQIREWTRQIRASA